MGEQDGTGRMSGLGRCGVGRTLLLIFCHLCQADMEGLYQQNSQCPTAQPELFLRGKVQKSSSPRKCLVAPLELLDIAVNILVTGG